MEQLFSNAVLKAFDEKKALLNNTSEDQKIVNQLFSNSSKVSKRLYGIDSFNMGIYFETEEELLHAIASYEIGIWSNLVILEYYEEFAGQKDVIRKVERNGNSEFLIVESTNELRRLDIFTSIKEKRYVWEIIPGKLRKEYQVLKNQGIKFSQDLYAEEDKLQEHQRRTLSKETFKA